MLEIAIFACHTQIFGITEFKGTKKVVMFSRRSTKKVRIVAKVYE